jgi:hypothetical protein
MIENRKWEKERNVFQTSLVVPKFMMIPFRFAIIYKWRRDVKVKLLLKNNDEKHNS